MSEVYRPINRQVRVTKESQLDRVEKKVDRILELLEGQELSTLEIGKLTDVEMKRFSLGPYSKTSTPGSVSS